MIIKSASFEVSAANLSGAPAGALPEFAFIGRSNVGKSSLINLLTQRRDLAAVSATPGKTRLLNFFRINNQWRVVDLPGYGFAKGNKNERADFNVAVADYLERGANVTCVFVLVDATIPPQRIDLEFLRWLDGCDVAYAVVLTKIDKISRGKLQQATAQFERELAAAGVALPEVFPVSSQTREGRDELLAFIESYLGSGEAHLPRV
ncbi:MAG TPA: ribosome biogenesis GTP-binding protein YihA/YsxC [Opitutaceae bacterium]|nr:ribosome biogenesis GTP-binding protein YihA/YsxC [Opitutaceae bacterium]